jgi:hypothetical protein
MTGSRGNKVAYGRAVARHGHRTITFEKKIGKSRSEFTNAHDEGFDAADPLPTDVLTAIDDAARKAQPKWPLYFYGVEALAID